MYYFKSRILFREFASIKGDKSILFDIIAQHYLQYNII
jgi:hypothetical protein